ncbi:2-hydroxy-3-keto-5-methylthiopentenyl-1-phosphate phosphatase [Bacillus sp. 7884-1]|uniref:2-hydroxy-3-keto-5-methylthiopentenyl-1- phosphate phosphatase n=1 Tax=Bacillus sp. 7884-1 TaxID=2021693 RepID=UPI000BA7AF7A|nr:2-hydroxy-3-keto-5-methylthiopentenyl-1-phosphate phosphatase [Bacillus sp. 7884-1]PAE31400.1 2-hydroxy-3-keto-5-methylthiopentenyl-1-phosphate phosphatase [Bacillus sp. 7884-1]
MTVHAIKKMVVFCDFDGTITENDNIINIMKFYKPPGWETIKDDILAGKISIRKGVGRMFGLLPASCREEITNSAIKQATIRPGFDQFIQYCQEHNIRLLITSGGIDFFVYPILSHYSVPKQDIFCNSSDFSGKHIQILWPYSCDALCSMDCGMCKPSILRSHSSIDNIKIVIGDSITDLAVAKMADLVIARDFLSQKCQEHSLPYKAFNSFYDVIKILKQFNN